MWCHANVSTGQWVSCELAKQALQSEQQPRAARSCHPLPASGAPATPTGFGGFPDLMQWRNSMTLNPETPQFALCRDWECQLFCPPLSKLSHALHYPVYHSQIPSLIVPGSIHLHQTSRNLNTAEELPSSFQKEQTKYTVKASVQNKQPGNVKINGSRILKMGSARLSWRLQAGHRVLCNLLDHSFYYQRQKYN